MIVCRSAGQSAEVGKSPRPISKSWEAELKAGRTLVTVHDADDRIDEARRILLDHGGIIRDSGHDIGTFGSGLPATPF